MQNKTETNEMQPRKPAPVYYRPIAGREQQWKHRSERIADCNFPADRLEEVNERDPFGWWLTHCPICGALAASVILDSGMEHFADLQLNEAGKLCAVVGQGHGCNRLFAAYAAAEADRGTQE
jgi:hypothetical protein